MIIFYMIRNYLKKIAQTIFNNFLLIFTFSSHKEYVKKKYDNRMIHKKECLFLMNVYVLYVLELKTSKKKFRLSLFHRNTY